MTPQTTEDQQSLPVTDPAPAPAQPDDGVIPLKELILHFLGLMGQNHSCNMPGGDRLPYFCQHVLGVDPGKTGIALSIPRLWDAVNDPIVGAYVDKHRFKNGEKLRPWLKYTSPFIAVFGLLMFTNFGVSSENLAIGLVLICYALWDFFYSFQDVAIWGVTAMCSPRSDQRTRDIQWAQMGATAGSWLPFLITPILGFRDKLDDRGVTLGMLFFVCAFIFCFGGSLQAMCAYGVKERVPSPPAEKSESMLKNFLIVRKNKIMMLLVLGTILQTLKPDLDLMYVYQQENYNLFGKEIPGELLITILIIVTGLPSLISMPFAKKLAARFGGMKNVLVIAKVVEILTRVIRYFIRYETLPRLILLHAVGAMSNFFGNITGIATKSLWGDSIDLLEWQTGARTEGISFSLQTFLSKLGWSVSTVIRGQVLKLLKYDYRLANRRLPQGPVFQHWIWPVYQLGPIIGVAMYLIPVLFVRYPDELKLQVESDLAERRAAAAAAMLEAVEETTV